MHKTCSSALVLLALAGISPPAAAVDNPADEAYRLRMAGKVDEAKALLEQAVAAEPGNAAALYELARTELHMFLGDLEEQHIAGAHRCIAEAVKRDPQKVMYHTFAGLVAYFQAYKALMTQQPGAKEHFAEVCRAFDAALALKPDYPQVLLYLVELHGAFPESAGADRAQAEQYARRLKGMGDVWAAKARSVLSPNACGIDTWKSMLADNTKEQADILEELGKAYLRDDQPDEAVKCFEQAVDRDSAKKYLLLDLSIYHTFRAMRAREDKELLQTSLRSGDAALTRYLRFNPIPPMQAYALGMQSKYKNRLGDEKEAGRLLAQAKALDPYFSKATGSPHPDIFIPPDAVSQNHRYLLRPF